LAKVLAEESLQLVARSPIAADVREVVCAIDLNLVAHEAYIRGRDRLSLAEKGDPMARVIAKNGVSVTQASPHARNAPRVGANESDRTWRKRIICTEANTWNRLEYDSVDGWELDDGTKKVTVAG
jgi:hypothetical protein